VSLYRPEFVSFVPICLALHWIYLVLVRRLVLTGACGRCNLSTVLDTLSIFLYTVVSFLFSTCMSKHPLFSAPCFSSTDLHFECSLIFQVNISPVFVCKKASIFGRLPVQCQICSSWPLRPYRSGIAAG
jgi:hypothetical protein